MPSLAPSASGHYVAAFHGVDLRRVPSAARAGPLLSSAAAAGEAEPQAVQRAARQRFGGLDCSLQLYINNFGAWLEQHTASGQVFRNPFVSLSLDAAHAFRYALGQKAAHGSSSPILERCGAAPRGIVVACLVPAERWARLRPEVTHVLHSTGGIALHPHRVWEREVVVHGFVDEDLVIGRFAALDDESAEAAAAKLVERLGAFLARRGAALVEPGVWGSGFTFRQPAVSSVNFAALLWRTAGKEWCFNVPPAEAEGTFEAELASAVAGYARAAGSARNPGTVPRPPLLQLLAYLQVPGNSILADLGMPPSPVVAQALAVLAEAAALPSVAEAVESFVATVQDVTHEVLRRRKQRQQEEWTCQDRSPGKAMLSFDRERSDRPEEGSACPSSQGMGSDCSVDELEELLIEAKAWSIDAGKSERMLRQPGGEVEEVAARMTPSRAGQSTSALSRHVSIQKGNPWQQGRVKQALTDRLITFPEGEITAAFVLRVLESISWPSSSSRRNVLPAGQAAVRAFPIGLVLDYARGLACSRTVRSRPRLARLLARFIGQQLPEMPFTTAQLNCNFSARLHVDAGNHGPSAIIALGDYTGGELWVYDPSGDVQVEVTEALRGWPELRVGSKIPGRAVDIRNCWHQFDGNVPHQVMPFQGSRFSIVFFTRKRWLDMPEHVQEALANLEFKIPGEEYMQAATAKPDTALSAIDEEEEEVDHDEELEEALQEAEESEEPPSVAEERHTPAKRPAPKVDLMEAVESPCKLSRRLGHATFAPRPESPAEMSAAPPCASAPSCAAVPVLSLMTPPMLFTPTRQGPATRKAEEEHWAPIAADSTLKAKDASSAAKAGTVSGKDVEAKPTGYLPGIVTREGSRERAGPSAAPPRPPFGGGPAELRSGLGGLIGLQALPAAEGRLLTEVERSARPLVHTSRLCHQALGKTPVEQVGSARARVAGMAGLTAPRTVAAESPARPPSTPAELEGDDGSDGNGGALDSAEEDDEHESDSEEEEEHPEGESQAMHILELEAGIPLPPLLPGPRPGHVGFNQHARRHMKEAGLPRRNEGTHGLLPAQQTVKHLVGERCVSRLLVNHRTGIGKTRTMVEVLSSAYGWRMAKIVIVPKKPLVTNFLMELVRWPSRWRIFWATQCPDAASKAAGGPWQERCEERWRPELLDTEARSDLRDTLALKGGLHSGRLGKRFLHRLRSKHPSLELPGGPLRIMNYTRAGGRAMEEESLDPVLKFGSPAADLEDDSWPAHDLQRPWNPWSGKLLLLDEAHNLVKPQERRFQEPLQHLREAVTTMTSSSILVALTATADRELLNVVKGPEATTLNDEGFISYFHKGTAGFATINVSRTAETIREGDKVATLVRTKLKGEALARYCVKEWNELLPSAINRDDRLATYAASWAPPQTVGRLKEELRQNPALAPKAQIVVDMIREEPLKTLVLVSKRTAYLPTLVLLQLWFAGKVVEMLKHDAFNEDVHGSRHRIMIADADACTEGVTFRTVRRVHLVDMPKRREAFVQALGRACRHGSHDALREADRDIRYFLHMAALPDLLEDDLKRHLYHALLPKTVASIGQRSFGGGSALDQVETWARELNTTHGVKSVDGLFALPPRQRLDGAPKHVQRLQRGQMCTTTVDERRLEGLRREIKLFGPQLASFEDLAVDTPLLD